MSSFKFSTRLWLFGGLLVLALAAILVLISTGQSTLAMGVAGGLILVVLLAINWLVEGIRQPLKTASAVASRIAQGDLTLNVKVSSDDEIGELMKALSNMTEYLSKTVQMVRKSTDSIAIASTEIASGNNDLSIRTEQTSSNLQAAASALHNLTLTVGQSADNAKQASSLATNASIVAERGGDVVRQVVTTMEDINQSSKKISDIIGVIDGIAFQTNILALNAAVEAARAGEQGRGFAVVAGEVRSLAGRSAEAAREIKSLINASVEKVESGTRLVTDAGTTMSDIVQSVKRVTDTINEITAAATEQSAGIGDVNMSMGSLDQMTQQNAALVEESAAAAESLREQAQQLASVVSIFKVDSRDFSGMDVMTRHVHSAPMAAPAPALAAAPAPRQIKSTAAAKPQLGNSAGFKPATKPALKTRPASPPANAKPVAPTATAASDDEWESF